MSDPQTHQQVILLLAGNKGLAALEAAVSSKYLPMISAVITARDPAIADDGHDAILACAARAGIHCTTDRQRHTLPTDAWHIAIGWRRLISDVSYGRLVVAHDSPLPRFRGFAPLVNMLVEGETELAVTYFVASDGSYDDGTILEQETVGISYPITIAQAIERICPLYAIGLLKVLDRIALGGPLEGRCQDPATATYSLWLDDEDYLVDLRWSAQRIARFVDAVGPPYRGAQVLIDGVPHLISGAAAEEQDLVIADRPRHIGKVMAVRCGLPVVVCGSGQLRISGLTRVQDGAAGLPLGSFRLRFTGRRT